MRHYPGVISNFDSPWNIYRYNTQLKAYGYRGNTAHRLCGLSKDVSFNTSQLCRIVWEPYPTAYLGACFLNLVH